MSRPWKISTAPPHDKTTVTANDKVETSIDLPPILPHEQQGAILSQVLQERGFNPTDDGKLSREDGGVKVEVDPSNGGVTISAEQSQDVPSPPPSSGGCPCASRLPQRVSQATLDGIAKGLQAGVTERVEKALAAIGCELERVGNTVTGKALVQKARSMGEVKRITHDNETGGVIIVVEV